MNYRHIYHAGNFADVVKHAILLTLLDALKRKEKPFCVLDSHAGIGLYDLNSTETQKKQEYQHGIARLFSSSNRSTPTIIMNYLEIIRHFNINDNLEFYPGSPLICASTLRTDDRLIACELHEDDVKTLTKQMYPYEQASTHFMNGYHAMKAFLPPTEARGLVLIDPPFEKTSEFDDIIESLRLALKHWRGGVYAIWYPIKDKGIVNRFYSDLKALSFPTLTVEFSLKNMEDVSNLISCGFVILNPPWKIQESLSSEILPYLANTLDASHTITYEN